jgi:hypothetical protein
MSTTHWKPGLLVLVLSACAGAQTPPPAAPSAGPTTPAAPPPSVDDGTGTESTELAGALVEARGTGRGEAEAYAAATERLAEAVYGDPRWAALLPGTIHDRAHDPYGVLPREGGGVEVRVGLSEDRVAGMLAILEQPPASLPTEGDPLTRELSELLVAARQELACLRRQALLDTACLPGEDVGPPAAARVAELATRLVLTSDYPDGVPLNDRGIPLRPAQVNAQFVLPEEDRRVPAPELPLRIAPAADGQTDGSADDPAAQAPGTLRTAVTSPEGRARVGPPPDRRWPGPLQVTVDADTLLGPLAAYWPGPVGLVLRGRPVGMARWTAVITERVQGSPASEAVVGPVVVRGLQARGRPAPVPPQTVEPLATVATVAELRERLDALVTSTEGRLDVVLVAEVDSEFARRAGAQRVWYEARGSLTAVHAWTGEALAEVDAAVTAQGLGEIRADRAARTQLAIALLTDLVAALPEGG